MMEPAALAHIEKTLADSYRKEIDQEENIWRSLPFFAATLAQQLAALFQVIERFPSGRSWPAVFSVVLVVSSVGCSLLFSRGSPMALRPSPPSLPSHSPSQNQGAPLHPRQPPPMRQVTKSWFTMREEPKTVEQLLEDDKKRR